MKRAWLIVFVALAQSDCTPKMSERARFFGRVDFADQRGPRFAWSATGFTTTCEGTDLRFTLVDLPKHPDPEGRTWLNRWRVVLDGQPPQEIVAEVDRVIWTSGPLAKGDHRLTVFKQTEAFVGEALLTQLACDGTFVTPDPPPPRRLEFIGDSLTTGYGNEGTSKLCHFTSETENQWLAFPSLTARALNAEVHVIAWSGKGVVQNYLPSDDAIDRLLVPQIFDRVLPERAESKWDFARWTPDAVVIGLGTNDISLTDPGESAFVAAYTALLRRVREHYKAAPIVCVLPPVTDAWPVGLQAWTKMRSYVSAAVRESGDQDVHVLAMPPEDPADGLGCDYHPSLARHEKIAAAVTDALSHVLDIHR